MTTKLIIGESVQFIKVLEKELNEIEKDNEAFIQDFSQVGQIVYQISYVC